MVDKVEKLSMNDEQNVDNYKQVVRVPECIESGQFVKRLRKLYYATSEPTCGESECHRHAQDHEDPGYAFWTADELRVRGPCRTEVFGEGKVHVRRGGDEPREVAGEVVTGVKDYSNHNCRCNGLS